MLHPLYPKFLLESTGDLDHIVTFKGDICTETCDSVETYGSVHRVFVVTSATLMEHGRHAAYILLTGPEVPEGDGTVVLRKQKLKHEVPSSKVFRIGGGGGSETNEDIKEAFNRLRFSDW